MVKGLLRGAVIGLVLCASALLVLVYRPREAAKPVISTERTGETPQDATLGQFSPLAQPLPAPALDFTRPNGTAQTLADFRGQWVLVNLWATWCAPCVREMPALDRLQARLGQRLKVLAISEDRGAAHVVEPFLEKLALAQLAIYLDAKGAAQSALEVRGLPTSYLIDPDGRIRGKLEGAAAWDSPDMVALLERYLGPADAAGAAVKGAAAR